MRNTLECYKDLNVEGVTIKSRRGEKGNKESGILEVIEIIGGKNGIYKGKYGRWRKGSYYDPEIFTHKEAVAQWQTTNLGKFRMVTN